MISSRHVGLLLFLALIRPTFAKEAVYLKTGFSFEADSHVRRDQTIFVQLGAGSLEFPIGDVVRIEQIPSEPAIPEASPLDKLEVQKPEDTVTSAAQLQGLDQAFLLSVAKVESRLHQEAISPKGAIGLMQLMPGTAAELGVNPKQPQENALGGAKYLRSLLIRYKGNSVLALAAYNAGPEAVAKFHGIPPYPETRRYIKLVLQEYERQLKIKSRTDSAARLQPGVNRPTATD
jgi:hypothetical protein